LVEITEQQLKKLFSAIEGKRIAVVGDLMLDKYIWGSVKRISPEAPVPVVEVETEQAGLGGAANVAANIQSLGGTPLLVGVIGSDAAGKHLHQIFQEKNFPTEGIIIDQSRPTTTKTRIIAHNQHVVRIDHESRIEISPTIQHNILTFLHDNIDSIDGIILEDYNKGVMVQSLIKEMITLARKQKKIITVDPKFNNFFEYKDVTLFKPNRHETEEALSVRMKNENDIIVAGKKLMQRLGAENILLTRGEHGMTLFERDGSISHMATKARNVADVSGAGDTVIATMTLALAGSASPKEAATLANLAGGVVVGYVGIVPINKNELWSAVMKDMNHEQQGTR
jgi:rfaE bifunctional protein kinase chain/domain